MPTKLAVAAPVGSAKAWQGYQCSLMVPDNHSRNDCGFLRHAKEKEHLLVFRISTKTKAEIAKGKYLKQLHRQTRQYVKGGMY